MSQAILSPDREDLLHLAPVLKGVSWKVLVQEPFQTVPTTRRVRILHTVGHLSRSGIETWLYQTIKRMDRTRFENVVLVLTKQEEGFTADFEAAGIKIVDAPPLDRPQLFCQSFLRLLREEGPFDILHAHGFSLMTTLSLTLARLTGLKERILHGHNDLRPLLVHRGWLYRAYVRASLGVCRALTTRRLACSQKAAEWTFGACMGTTKERQAELLIGTDLESCLLASEPGLRARLGIPEERFVLAQVGRFTVAKNHTFTLEVVRLLAKSHSNLHVVFMGDGPLRATMQKEMDRMGLGGNVTWLPNCKEVPAILRSVVDAVLFPSLHEGLGLAVVEAQAAGVPVLISDTVTRECVIVPQLTDFLPIDQGPAPWVQRILALVREPRSRTHNREHHQAVVTSRFRIAHSVARLSALYLELAERVPGGTGR